ncbi:hypothetical protein MMC28_003550 [Mycoblastus sanguinarius]|nr:hypothetical protein [Mycoblastus sanguinarius]
MSLSDTTDHPPVRVMNGDLEKALGTFDTDRLSIYREQVGIVDVLEIGPQASRRPARNIGIYKRIASEERKARLQYYSSAFLINTCLLSQVIFAAALTALGAGNGSHTQITVLGAANTVVAALLTFTKGQGLPNRLRQYQNSLRKVREYIEQRERDFAQRDSKLNLGNEIHTIKMMYEEVRQNDENNDPSSYHNTSPASSAKEGSLPVAIPLISQKMQDQSAARVIPFVPPISKPASRKESSKDEPAARETPYVPPVSRPISRKESSKGEPLSTESPDHPLCKSFQHGPDAGLTPEIGTPLQREDSGKWTMAYQVADKLVSGRHNYNW